MLAVNDERERLLGKLLPRCGCTTARALTELEALAREPAEGTP